MKIREDYTCPLEIVHDIIKGKWKTIILFQLGTGEHSLSELEHQIDGISQKMLLEQLKELQDFGLVEKIKYEGYPLRVGYMLTKDRGYRMLQAVLIMQGIGVEYLVEHGKTDILDQKGIHYQQSDKQGADKNV